MTSRTTSCRTARGTSLPPTPQKVPVVVVVVVVVAAMLGSCGRWTGEERRGAKEEGEEK